MNIVDTIYLRLEIFSRPFKRDGKIGMLFNRYLGWLEGRFVCRTLINRCRRMTSSEMEGWIKGLDADEQWKTLAKIKVAASRFTGNKQIQIDDILSYVHECVSKENRAEIQSIFRQSLDDLKASCFRARHQEKAKLQALLKMDQPENRAEYIKCAFEFLDALWQKNDQRGFQEACVSIKVALYQHSDDKEMAYQCLVEMDRFLSKRIFKESVDTIPPERRKKVLSAMREFFPLANEAMKSFQGEAWTEDLRMKLANLPAPVDRAAYPNICFDRQMQLSWLAKGLQKREMEEKDPATLKRLAKARRFFETQDKIPLWYHATKEAGCLGIIRSGKINVCHKKHLKGAWVSEKYEKFFGNYVIGMTEGIQLADEKPRITLHFPFIGRRWRGLQYAVPINKETLVYAGVPVQKDKNLQRKDKEEVAKAMREIGLAKTPVFSSKQIDFMQREIKKIIGNPNLPEGWWGR